MSIQYDSKHQKIPSIQIDFKSQIKEGYISPFETLDVDFFFYTLP